MWMIREAARCQTPGMPKRPLTPPFGGRKQTEVRYSATLTLISVLAVEAANTTFVGTLFKKREQLARNLQQADKRLPGDHILREITRQ